MRERHARPHTHIAYRVSRPRREAQQAPDPCRLRGRLHGRDGSRSRSATHESGRMADTVRGVWEPARGSRGPCWRGCRGRDSAARGGCPARGEPSRGVGARRGASASCSARLRVMMSANVDLQMISADELTRPAKVRVRVVQMALRRTGIGLGECGQRRARDGWEQPRRRQTRTSRSLEASQNRAQKCGLAVETAEACP